MQGNLKHISATGYAGGDMVMVTIDGKFHVTNIVISDQAINTKNAKVIADLVKAAFHDAHQRVQEQIKEKIGSAEMSDMLGDFLK